MAVRDETPVRDHRRAFEEAWPAVETRLRRVLAARGAPPDDHDDYLQEVAARALAAENLRFESPDELLPWAATVLRRLHIDAHRRASTEASTSVNGGRRADRTHVVEVMAATDVAIEVEARMELDAVAKVIATWSPDNRQVLLSAADDGTRRPSAFYVRRHRLRLKLLAAMEGLGGLLGNVWRRIDPTAMVDRLRSIEAAQPAATAVLAPVAAACAMALLLGGLVAGGDGASGSDGASGGAGAGPSGGARRSVTAVADAASGDAPAVGAQHDPGRDDTRDSRSRDSDAPRPRKGSVVPTVEEHRVEGPEAAGYEPTAGVENREGPQPLWCYWDKPVLGDGCVGEAISVPI